MIYLIEHVTTGSIKIGYATDVKRRLRQFQCACPDHLKLIGTFVGSIEHERMLHQELRQIPGIQIRGEWYKPIDVLSDRIEMSRFIHEVIGGIYHERKRREAEIAKARAELASIGI